MNMLLWVVQVLLALAFLAHGVMFLNPPPEIVEQMNASLPRWFQVFLGIAEVAAAAGLTLPAITRILPGLVPAAAIGVIIVTVSATALHLWRAEYSSAGITFVLFLLAAYVAYGRMKLRPIVPRGAAARA